jgi:hypothetical protein
MIDTQPDTSHAAAPSARFASTRVRRMGLALTAFSGLFLLFDGVVHVLRITAVVDSFAALGYPVTAAVGIGILELLCLALYLVPRTSVLGAVLLTGYLGGAVSAQVRVDAPLFSTLLFPVYLGILIWGGLFLRDARLRSVLPLRGSDRS